MSLDAIGIVSRDIKKSVTFYKILGVSMEETASSNHLEGLTPSGVRIMLDSIDLVREIDPNWEQPSGNCGVVLCFKQDSPDQVNTLYKKILEAGYKGHKTPWDAFWGQRYCSVLDPDGNQIDIFASLNQQSV